MLAFRHRFFDKGAKPRFPNADPKKDTRSSCAYQQPAAIITNRTAGNRQISLPDFGLSHPLKARDRISQANRAGSGLAPERAHRSLRLFPERARSASPLLAVPAAR